LVKKGPGTLTLQSPVGQSNRINYSGDTLIQSGKLRLVDLSGGVGSFNSPLDVGPGAELEVSSSQTMATRWNFSRRLSGTGTLIKTGAGVWGLTNIISLGGQVEVRQGRLMSDGNASNWSGCTADATVMAGAELDMRADPMFLDALNGAGTVTNSFGGGGTDLLTLGVANGDGVFSGVLRATGDGALAENRGRVALLKTGSGSQAFTGAVQIYGPVTVTQGVMRVSGWMSNPLTATDIGPAAVFHLDGGIVTSQVARVRFGGLLHGCGILVANLINDGTVVLDCPSSGLQVTGNVTNNGRMRLINGNALSASGTFTNNGILDLITGAQALPANFVNNGTVLYSSSVLAVSPASVGGIFEVSIDSQPGHNYQLQRADGPSGPWSDTGAAQAGSAGRLAFTDPSSSPDEHHFYRFMVNP
jgi:hypothetical protein